MQAERCRGEGPTPGFARLVDDFTVCRWTTDDGLPERVVQGVSQGPDGYLWVATFRHVLRFDGKRFVEHGCVGREIAGGPAEIIVQVLACRGGDVLVRTTHAVWRFDGALWTRLLDERPDPERMSGMYECPDNADVVVTTSSRVVVINPGDGSRDGRWSLPWTIHRKQPLEPHGETYMPRPVRIRGDVRRVWDLGSWNGEPIALTSDRIVAHRDEGWVTLCETPAPTSVLLGDEANGGIWCGGDGGLWFVRDPANAATWAALINGQSPINATIRGLEADEQGNVWAATDAGLVRLRRRESGGHLVVPAGASPGINAVWVSGDGTVWAAPDEGGLVRLPAGKRSADALEAVSLDDAVRGLQFDAVTIDQQGTLWLGTDGAYLWRCATAMPPEQIVYRERGRRMAVVAALAWRTESGLWIGSGDGLFRVAADGSCPEPLDDGDNPVVPVSAIDVAADGSFWCGTVGAGAVRRSADGRPIARLDANHGLPTTGVLDVFRDRGGTVWFGTEAGLVRHMPGTACATGFPPGSGLHGLGVVQIEEDHRGRLWLGTRRGIVMFDPKSLAPGDADDRGPTIRRLDAGGPLADVACRGRAGRAMPPTSGRPLVFATDRGLVLVDPDSELPETVPPRVLIEEVTLAGHAPDKAGDLPVEFAPRTVDAVRLPAGATDVTVHFTALNLADPERPVFRYRLTTPVDDGRDGGRAWRTAGRERSVTFRSLSSGRHLFEVTAGVDGAWQERAARIVLDVAPQWWERPAVMAAVIAVCAVALAGTVAVGLRQRYRRQLARELAVQRERERIARDIHDDLGAGLTQVALLSDIAADDLDDPAAMERHLGRIFKTSRELASSLDEIVWAVNPGNDTLEKLVSFIGEFTQDFLGSSPVRCRLDLPAQVPPLKVGAAVRHHLCMVLKEALNNAVRHSGATEVTAGVDIEGRTVRLTVRDDGGGLEPAAISADRTGRRNGLDDMRRRMAEVHGTLRVAGNAAGTIVTAEVRL